MRDLSGVRIGVVREFMQPFTKADEDSIASPKKPIADLKSRRPLVDPGPKGALFGTLLPNCAVDGRADSGGGLQRTVSSRDTYRRRWRWRAKREPAAGLNYRLLSEREPPTTGEVLFRYEKYLRDRGDANIHDVSDLIEKSTF